MIGKASEKTLNITMKMLNRFLKESGWTSKDLLLELAQHDFEYSELFNKHHKNKVKRNNISDSIISNNNLDDEFSKWWKKKPTKFQKLYNLGVEHGLLLEKDSTGRYILGKVNDGEWICKTLKEVESILNDEIREYKESVKNGGWVVDTIVHNGKIVKQGEITIES